MLIALSCGCVERKMLIRSSPSGAPVWVDEKPAGTTPVDYSFVHYGLRRIRVGPIREKVMLEPSEESEAGSGARAPGDEKGRILYRAAEGEVEIKPPWYQRFPVDFFYEVLYPGLLVDEQLVELTLKPVSDLPERFTRERAEEIVKEAEEFRNEALTPPPELDQ